jgi:antitoxin component YwqK of YwqJK toxin-antitoxin module
MKLLSLILLLNLIISGRIYSQYDSASVNPNGYNIIYYPNGKILSEGYLKNGRPEGYWKTYYTTGIIKSEGNRKNFLLDSVWIFYNSTGDTISQIHYLLGKKNGYYIEYNTDRSRPEYIGNIKSKELYVNDLKQGLSYYFYNDGKLKESITYTDDKEDGLDLEYAEDARIITIKNYARGSLVERQKINRYNDNDQKDGEWLEFYENLKVKKETNYKNGLLHGYYKEYSPDGRLLITLLYDEGRLVEEVKEEDKPIVVKEKFNNKGVLIESGPYIDDIPVGIHKTYNETGEITGSKIYDDIGVLLSSGIIDREGNKKGDWRDYYRDGNIRDEGRYVNNLREGKWIFYFQEGSVEQVGFYKNGLENGEWIRYYKDGNVYIQENYFNGKEDGIYSEYDEAGNIITQGGYIEGEKESEWILHVNDFDAKGSYITGLRDGKWKYFYDDGTLLFEGNYIQGNPDGTHKYYYPNGQLKEEQNYANGIPSKNWKRFDEEGNLIVTITYVDGKEYRINGVRIDLPDSNTKILK